MKSQRIRDIDSACAAIYNRVMPFSEEYKLREQQAIDYLASGADAPQVQAFATSAGIPMDQAAQTVVQQGQQFRQALSALGVLRMRKFALAQIEDEAQQQALFAEVMTQIYTIGESL